MDEGVPFMVPSKNTVVRFPAVHACSLKRCPEVAERKGFELLVQYGKKEAGLDYLKETHVAVASADGKRTCARDSLPAHRWLQNSSVKRRADAWLLQIRCHAG